MILEVIVFAVAAVFALAGAVGIVLLRNPFYSVLALVVHLVALATLFLLLSSAFVAAAQVVVYAGAVMVLYVFVAAYIGGGDEPTVPGGDLVGKLGPLFALALFVELVLAVSGSGLVALGGEGAPVPAAFGSPAQIGELLLTKFLVVFEAASLLLLVAAVGAVVLARRRRGLPDVGDPAAGEPALASSESRASRAGGRPGVSASWYVLLSALIFCVGAAGVMSRRSPLVILLCLELMLNAGNLALVAFGRMHGSPDGQIFALVVMVVAACEVVVGLGLIVAMYRRRIPIDVDQVSVLRG